jgi:vancomycin resistance protein YoaR
MIQKLISIIQKTKPILQPALKILLTIFIVFAVLVFGFQLTYWQRIYPRVMIASVNVGGKEKKQALNILQQYTAQPSKKLIFTYDKQRWEIPLSILSFSYLPQKSAQTAYFWGRTGNFTKDLHQQLTALTKGTNLNFQYNIDHQLLENKIASIAAQLDKPAIPPEIQLVKEATGSVVMIQAGQRGQQLQKELLLEIIDHHLSQRQSTNFQLPVKHLLPEVTEEQLQNTKKRAEKLLDKELVLSSSEQSWTLGEATLIDFLDFQNNFDSDKIASYTAQLTKSIDRPPQNALFNFVPGQGRVVEFKPAVDGQALDQPKTVEKITTILHDLESSQNKQQSLELPVAVAKPEISTQDVNNLGIKERIGRGESYFRGSISSRIHNIQTASKQINGILIAPGEVFSLNEALGDVSIQTGYQKAWIIKEGRTVLGDGGGVCQVSTTLFRAILNAGLPVIERQAHDYRVSYYEQNYQVGVDATVFSPSPDLKFENDTPAHILIQTTIDTANSKATYDLYGTYDGRTVTISPSRIWDQSPPPPALYQDDPTLPAGVVKQIDWSAWGAKTSFDWLVERAGETLQSKTFYSNYRPWQAVFLRGTGP